MPHIELVLDRQIIFLCISTHSLNNQCFIHRNERNDYYTVDPTKAHVMEMKVTSKQYKINFAFSQHNHVNEGCHSAKLIDRPSNLWCHLDTLFIIQLLLSRNRYYISSTQDLRTWPYSFFMMLPIIKCRSIARVDTFKPSSAISAKHRRMPSGSMW